MNIALLTSRDRIDDVELFISIKSQNTNSTKILILILILTTLFRFV